MGFDRARRGRRRVLGFASAAAIALAMAAPARAGPAQAVNIPEGPLDAALVSLAAQTRQQLLYTPDLVQGRRAPALAGRFTAEEALQRLLRDGDVVVARAGPNVLVLKRRPAAATPAAAVQGDAGPDRPFVDEAAAPLPTAAGPAPAASRAPPAQPHTVEEVRVTGSNIRGVARGATPLVVLEARDLEATGRATVAEGLQLLPQNYGGESTESTVTTRGDRTGTNAGYGTAVNLRGLGSDATLVLVNGRRMAGSGLRGDFADLSTIPNVALERVEVLLDGASAIYGSDAVGGVVNLILRRDFDGAEVRARAGAATRGEPAEGQLGAAFGRVWSGGSALIAYEGYRRTAMDASDRDFTGNADLRPLGGSDRRETLSFPGNIVALNPATGASAPFYGIPPGQPGTALTPASFQAGVINRQNQNLGVDILADQRCHSLYAAARQEIGERLELSADLRYGARKARSETYGSTTTLTVTRGNPFFVSPTGAASHQIQYAFQAELGNPVSYAGVEALSGSLGGRLRLPGAWEAQAYGAASQEIDESVLSGIPNFLVLNEALGTTPDNPATAFSTARDGFFNPFAGQPANSAAVRSAIATGFSNTRIRNQVFTGAGQADGPLFRLPGGDLRMAAGVQARRETYRRTGASLQATAAPVAQAPLDVDRTLVAAFAELQAPLVGPDNRRPGLEALELTAAVRGERYGDFGETVNPKAGLVWSPAAGLRLRAGYSESFRAPALQELYEPQRYNPIRLLRGPGRVLTLALNGGNPGLAPERATSWSAGLEVRPEALPGLRVAADWYRIDFRDRVDRPVLANLAGALTDPRLAPFVRSISPATSTADLELITRLLADPATTTALGVFPPTEYAAIVDIRNVNTSRLEVEGVDAEVAYAADAFGGRLALRANGAWMLHYEQQLTPTDTATDLAGVVGRPPEFRGRVTADWTRGAWGAGLSLNHQAGQADLTGARVDAGSTLDVRLRRAGEPGSRLDGLTFTLTVRNLFDSGPPFYDNPTGLAFDPASGDPIGRFVAVQLARRW